ncbi:urease accessory protein UreF [Kutzneria buriramensis]|uniref:Urease accessory protein n=1 Tax=Kutzneria buriramensis TaxID=1045776 RepID=A0A3E0GWN8_9PSEU|nr:urease accessory UreF family protein [Kutzneria buriramensis]REH29444.1 urease accessory protein [Kutzneria buriramensis]
MTSVRLVLADSRFPGGGHAHSGGVEEAAARGLITDETSLKSFLYGRLRTNGLVSAAFAAAAVGGDWFTLDVELDARTPSPAQRAASRAQGRSTLRAGRVAWPSPRLDALSQPHHAIAIGALVDVAGGTPEEAAECAAYLSVSGPASAAVRLLGLDPFRVNAIVAQLDIAAVTEEALSGLPMLGAPALDLFADSHARIHQQEVRLFVS